MCCCPVVTVVPHRFSIVRYKGDVDKADAGNYSECAALEQPWSQL